MGEGTTGIGPEQESRQLEHHVEELRGELTAYLSELDRRRHDATDVRLQLSRRKGPLGIVGALLLAGLGAWVYVSLRRRRELRRPSVRARRLRQAVGRMIADPKKVARSSPSVPEKILGAAGSTLATIAVKRIAGFADSYRA